MEKAEKQSLLSLSEAREWLERYHRALRCRTGPGRASCERTLEKLTGQMEAATGLPPSIDGIRERLEADLRDCEERVRANRARREKILGGFPELDVMFRALDQGSLPPRARWAVLSDDLPLKPLGDFYLLRGDFSTDELAVCEQVLKLRDELIILLEEHSANTRLLRVVLARLGAEPPRGAQQEFTFDASGRLVRREEPSAHTRRTGEDGGERHRPQTLARIREVRTVAGLGLELPAACYQLTRKRIPLPSRKLQAAHDGDWHAWLQANPRAFRRFWQHCLADKESDRT